MKLVGVTSPSTTGVLVARVDGDDLHVMTTVDEFWTAPSPG